MKGREVGMTNKEMADFLSELRNRNEMPIDEDEYYLLGSIADDLREQGTVVSIKDVEIKEPICKIIFDIPYYFCGNCKTMLNMYGVKANFCSECGCAVNWSRRK